MGTTRRVEFIVGAPVWDRAWSLPLWFQSVRANVDPAVTGLCFVVPPSDDATRDAIARLSWGFAWVEVLRDRGPQVAREDRSANNHRTLARARNQILQVVERVRPRWFVSWDTDMLVPVGTVARVCRRELPLVTIWTWLNRQAPRRLLYQNGAEPEEVFYQDAVQATAMDWDPHVVGRARHYPGEGFVMRSRSLWPCGVALAWQLMDERAYRYAHYAPHHDGEDVPFNWMLHSRGIQRMCLGDVVGVHLYDRFASGEIALGWPDVMMLAKQKPLAAEWTGPRTVIHQALGFYPLGQAAS